MLRLAAFVLSISCVLVTHTRAQDAAKRHPKEYEYGVFAFEGDKDAQAQKLRELAADGWEYLGPTTPGLVAFKRSPLLSQRAHILGVWQINSKQGKGTIEFMREGKLRLTGYTQALSLQVPPLNGVLAVKGDQSVLEYRLPDESVFIIYLYPERLKLDAERRQVFSEASGYDFDGSFSHVRFRCKMALDGDKLTFSSDLPLPKDEKRIQPITLTRVK